MAGEDRLAFGDLLRRYRGAAGLTQEALAERARLSARAISDLERGVKHAPRPTTVQLLAQTLGLSEPEHAAFLAAARRLEAPGRRERRAAGAAPEPALQGLPGYLTPLLGREHEEAAVAHLLRRPDVRLLTLTGAGGVGKTRLAVHVAAGLHEAFPDGVVFVSLASLRDPGLVLTTLAQALGIQEAGSHALEDSLRSYLREKQALLLLDNFEQVVSAAPHVAALLASCPGLKALVTSRMTLHVRGEQQLTVPPLALPDLARLPDVATLGQYAAVALFAQRAQAIKPDLRLTEANARAIAAICVRLDGLPLALELAAAWVQVLSPLALLTRLARRLPMLAGGAQDLPERLQTMRSAIAWSYDLLEPEEQALFRRLAVFAGGCSLEAAENVCTLATDSGLVVLDGLAALVDKHLVQQEEQAQGEPRFGMLETIREYAWERLEASGEATEVRGRHAQHYLMLAEEAEPALSGPQQAVWLARLEAEHGNLRAVLTWSIQTGAAETGLRLAGALWRFWWMRGHYSEGRGWLEEILARSPGAATAVRTKVLRGAGVLAFEQGDYAQATALHEEALALCRDLGQTEGIANALNNLGLVAWAQGAYGRATALCEEALALFRDLGNRRGIATTLNNLGDLARAQGDVVRATSLYHEGLALCRTVGDTWVVASCLEGVAGVAGGLGQEGRAARLFGAADAVRTALGVPVRSVHRSLYDRDVSAACAALRADTFAAAWAAGRALPLEQAIAEALQGCQLDSQGPADSPTPSPVLSAPGRVDRRTTPRRGKGPSLERTGARGCRGGES